MTYVVVKLNKIKISLRITNFALVIKILERNYHKQFLSIKAKIPLHQNSLS